MRFSGPYADWAQATARANGYDDPSILQEVLTATRAVLAGRAAFERDSALFLQPAMPMTLLAVVLGHALRNPGPLVIIDFGGSLGSSYRHVRPYLPPLPGLRWCVVEQSSFVEAGRAEFSTDELQFHFSLDELKDAGPAPLLLASGVLAYLPEPTRVLEDFSASGARTLFIDRTPMSDLPEDIVCVQHTPRFVYRSSYPCWALSRAKLLSRLATNWRLTGQHDCPRDGGWELPGGQTFAFRGLLFER